MSRPVRLTLLVSAVFAAAASSVAFLIQASPENGPNDFMVFWQAGRAAEPYAPRVFPFVNPPPALILFKPLGQLPLDQALLIWTAASIALFIWAASRMTGLGAAVLSMVSPPAVRGVFLGQCSMLLSGLVLLAFSIPGFTGGLLLGLVAAMKPQLVLLAPVALIARKDWQMLSGMAASAIGLAALSALLWPDAWSAWVAALPQLHQSLIDLEVETFVITPMGQADSLGLPPLPFLLLGAGVSLVAIWTLSRRLEGPYLAGLVIAASLFASPYAMQHDLVALVPIAILLIFGRNWNYGKFHFATPGSFQYLNTPAPGNGPVEAQMR